MGIQEWSERILLAHLADDPAFTDCLDAVMDNLTAKGGRDVVLDFKAVSFLNSSNVARLLRLRKWQHDHGRKLSLCGPGPQVRSVFVVTGLDAIFDLRPEVSMALAELQAGR